MGHSSIYSRRVLCSGNFSGNFSVVILCHIFVPKCINMWTRQRIRLSYVDRTWTAQSIFTIRSIQTCGPANFYFIYDIFLIPSLAANVMICRSLHRLVIDLAEEWEARKEKLLCLVKMHPRYFQAFLPEEKNFLVNWNPLF